MKKTVTLNLNNKELNVLENLCGKKGLSKTALLKQALSLYQVVHEKIELGNKIYFENDLKDKSEMVIL